MPEGPEIRRAADRVQAVLAGQRLQEVFFAFGSLQPWCRILQGQSVVAVDTIGKHMLVRFDSGLRLYSHNQLYGRWYVRQRDQYPDTGRSLRVGLHTDRHSALLYSASAVDVIREDELDRDPRLAGLGPDPLHASLSQALVRRRLDDPEFRRRQLAALLLDQGFFAGLGNYLRSEILFAARVHPQRRPADCADSQLDALARAILRLPRRSYRTGGITNGDTLVKRLRKQGVSREALRFQVFGRDGQGCYRCGQKIVRASAGGRRTYYCPGCQTAEDV
jgi:endonuclease VIII